MNVIYSSSLSTDLQGKVGVELHIWLEVLAVLKMCFLMFSFQLIESLEILL